ncbi:hypothetical protein PCH_Pc13g15990 [Penicillium rubens Wisconsin 54-1255]|uniref:Uncharacterized protein n=1 Tax=Penicillium rubens (strain ATCC 28089 / DSM 1075 / NRRL 1951 / Wisconsin 54-1255) TaxID=500485 RepID=B6H323_PENRW|nr:hypothetical protein PCH_Pc13g15990 [Penicillium rubens Wisconsin 54-1255]
MPPATYGGLGKSRADTKRQLNEPWKLNRSVFGVGKSGKPWVRVPCAAPERALAASGAASKLVICTHTAWAPVDPPSAKVKDFPAFLRIGNSRAFAGLSHLGPDQGYGTTPTFVLPPPWRVL